MAQERRILGIDIRVCAVKVVELAELAGKWRIVNWGIDEVPFNLVDKHPDKEVAQAKAIQKIITSKNIKTKDVVVIVGGGSSFSKHFTIPKVGKGEMTEAVRWKFKEEVSFPLDKAVVDFVEVKGSGANIDVVGSVASNEAINRIISVVEASGLNIIKIIPVPFAIKEICTGYLKESGDKVTSLVYMGRRTTNISFFKGLEFRFNREIPIGGEDITKAMTSSMLTDGGRVELSFDEAEKIKLEHEAPLSKFEAVVRPALEKVLTEITNTIEYYKGQDGISVIDKVLITGGTSKTPNIIEFLSKSLGIEFKDLKEDFTVEIDPKIPNKEVFQNTLPQMIAVAGAVLSTRGNTINLLPKSLKDKKFLIFKKYFDPVKILAWFIGISLPLYFGFSYIVGAINSEDLNVKNKINELRPRVIQLEEFEKAMKAEEGRRGVFKSIEISRVEINKILEDISANIPSTVLLNSVRFIESTKGIRIKGTVFSKGDSAENILAKFIYDLSKAPSFQKVELVEAVKNSEFMYDSFNFEINCEVKKKG